MKSYCTLLLLLSPMLGHAASFCPQQKPQGDWGVQYQLSGSQPATLLLLRQQAQTALYNPQNQMAEWWRFDNASHPEFSRVFAAAKRRIDYYQGDLRTLNVHVNQTEIESFAAAHLRQVLTPVAQNDCATAEAYAGEYQQIHYELLWSVPLGLPLKLQTEVKGKVTTLQAQQLLDSTSVTTLFARWQNYQRTDFADVGDNEQDPFLAKMINQGFVEHSEHAAYDSQGKPLGSHGH